MDLQTLFEDAGRNFEARAYETAFSEFNQILEVDAGHLGALFGRARCLLKTERYAESLATYEVLVRKYPQNSDALSEKGVILFRAGRLDDALIAMNKAVEIDPYNPYRYSSRAYIRSRLNDVFGAVEDYKKTIELDPEDATAYNNLGLLEERMGFESAKDHLSRADELTGGRQEAPAPEQAVGKPKTEGRNEAQKTASAPEIETQKPMKTDKDFSVGEYGRLIGEALTSREGFREFLAFVKNKINPKK